MKKKNNTKIVLGIIFVASIAVIVGSLSYAYFSIDTSDNKNQEVVIQSGTMQLKFTDNDTGFNGKLNFGESAEKLFILENTGTLLSKAKINFVNMINTYLDGSLTYKLEYKVTEEGTTWTEVLSKKNVPQSNTVTEKVLINNLEVPVGQKYYYRLTITLEDLDGVDQTQDLNAIFSTEFNIEEASESGSEKLLAKTNPASITSYTEGVGTEMYTFNHEATEQTPALIDYRYIGSNPYNYIEFNDEVWRIIGVFPVLNGETGEYEDRIKIMRNGASNYVIWNYGGTNEWVGSTIATYLNKDFYNKTGSANNNGIKEKARNQIASATWYLGAVTNYAETDMGASKFYLQERGNQTAIGEKQTLAVEQNVGLIYPSDWIYTYGYDVATTCYEYSNGCRNSSEVFKSWMFNDLLKTNHPWTMTSLANTSNYVLHINSDQRIICADKASMPSPTPAVLPVVYLKSDINIVDGTGAKYNPYILSQD